MDISLNRFPSYWLTIFSFVFSFFLLRNASIAALVSPRKTWRSRLYPSYIKLFLSISLHWLISIYLEFLLDWFELIILSPMGILILKHKNFYLWTLACLKIFFLNLNSLFSLWGKVHKAIFIKRNKNLKRKSKEFSRVHSSLFYLGIWLVFNKELRLTNKNHLEVLE